MLFLSLIAIFSVLIDQALKFIVEKNLYDKSVPIIENVLYFTYLENNGAAWGIFSNNKWILHIFIPIIIVLLIIYFYKNHKNVLGIISGGIVIGGALGNYIDRFFRGYVVDFIDFKIWPVFNFADICVVVGCILMIIDAFTKREIKK